MAVPWAGPGPIARANVSVPPGAGLGHEAGKEGEVRKVTEQSGKIGLSQVRGGQRERCREEPGEGRFRRAQLLQAALARGRNRRTRLGGHQRASQEQCPPQWQHLAHLVHEQTGIFPGMPKGILWAQCPTATPVQLPGRVSQTLSFWSIISSGSFLRW